MFATFKRKLLGDRRPVDRRVENHILGSLIYSDDDDAWLTEEGSTQLKFSFYISGSTTVRLTNFVFVPTALAAMPYDDK